MAGQNWVPFPRQTLLGTPTGPVTYESDIFDATEFGWVTWTLRTAGILPGTVSNPARYFIQTAMDLAGPWSDLIPGGTAPNFGNPVTGDAAVTGRYLQAVVVVDQAEAAVVEVRAVVRKAN